MNFLHLGGKKKKNNSKKFSPQGFPTRQELVQHSRFDVSRKALVAVLREQREQHGRARPRGGFAFSDDTPFPLVPADNAAVEAVPPVVVGRQEHFGAVIGEREARVRDAVGDATDDDAKVGEGAVLLGRREKQFLFLLFLRRSRLRLFFVPLTSIDVLRPSLFSYRILSLVCLFFLDPAHQVRKSLIRTQHDVGAVGQNERAHGRPDAADSDDSFAAAMLIASAILLRHCTAAALAGDRQHDVPRRGIGPGDLLGLPVRGGAQRGRSRSCFDSSSSLAEEASEERAPRRRRSGGSRRFSSGRGGLSVD